MAMSSWVALVSSMAVVEQGGPMDSESSVQLQVGHDLGHRQGVGDIRVSRPCAAGPGGRRRQIHRRPGYCRSWRWDYRPAPCPPGLYDPDGHSSIVDKRSPLLVMCSTRPVQAQQIFRTASRATFSALAGEMQAYAVAQVGSICSRPRSRNTSRHSTVRKKGSAPCTLLRTAAAACGR